MRSWTPAAPGLPHFMHPFLVGVYKWLGGFNAVMAFAAAACACHPTVCLRLPVRAGSVLLLRELDRQARQQGGAVYMLNGNHESLNVAGDFRCAAGCCLHPCAKPVRFVAALPPTPAAAVRAVPLACLPAYLRHQPSDAIAQYPASRFPPRLPCSYVTPGAFFESARAAGLSEADIAAGDQRRILQARWYLYQPGGAMARELAKNPTVLVVNDVVFAHGGLLPHHLKYGLQRINDEVGDWMNGATRPDGTQAAPPFPAMGDANSVQWNRTFGKERVSDCECGLRVLRCRARQRTGLAVCGSASCSHGGT